MPIDPPNHSFRTSSASVDAPSYKRRASEGDVACATAKRQRTQSLQQAATTECVTPCAGDTAGVQRAFRDAIVAGDVAGLRRALQQGAATDAPMLPERVPALAYAAERPHLVEVLRALLAVAPQAQASVSPIAPLFVAVAAGNLLGVQLLLQHGADPFDARGPTTPYRFAELACDFTAGRLAILHAFFPYVSPAFVSPAETRSVPSRSTP